MPPEFACRVGCGACCIQLGIAEPYENHPYGKAAGERCRNLTPDNRCGIYERRPPACSGFQASPQMCGSTYEEAMLLLPLMALIHGALMEAQAL